MEQQKPSSLALYPTDYELSDDSEFRELIGAWKRFWRAVAQSPDSTPTQVDRALKKLFKDKK